MPAIPGWAPPPVCVACRQACCFPTHLAGPVTATRSEDVVCIVCIWMWVCSARVERKLLRCNVLSEKVMRVCLDSHPGWEGPILCVSATRAAHLVATCSACNKPNSSQASLPRPNSTVVSASASIHPEPEARKNPERMRSRLVLLLGGIPAALWLLIERVAARRRRLAGGEGSVCARRRAAMGS